MPYWDAEFESTKQLKNDSIAGLKIWGQWRLTGAGSATVLLCASQDITLRVVTICTASLTFNSSTFCPHSVFMCFVWIWEQTAIISLYSINWLVFITETECVYCAVRTGSLYIILRSAHTVCLCVLCGSENKQWLFPYAALTDWFLLPWWEVFTVRYGLIPYIKLITFRL